MNEKENKKSLESYLPYMIAGVLLVLVVIGGVLLFGGKDNNTDNPKPPVSAQTDPSQGTATDPNQGTDTQPSETEDTQPQQTQPGGTEDSQETQPQQTEYTPAPTQPTDPPVVNSPYIDFVIPDMWVEYMSHKLEENENGHRHVFYTLVQNAPVELFAVTYGYVEKDLGVAMGTYTTDEGETLTVGIVSYRPTPADNWTDGDSRRVEAMREEINSILGQLFEAKGFAAAN